MWRGNHSATLAQALRQASKNIMYTVANSGNYTERDANADGLDNMTKIFIGVDVLIGLLTILIGAFVIIRCRKIKYQLRRLYLSAKEI